MAVVIRLQGLRMDAGSQDIRNFFTGLKIPDGGVHIVGGPLEEAFIIFASDDHARQAMARSGRSIRGSPVNLLLSSKAEMQNVLEASSKRPKMSRNRGYNERFRRPETNMDASNFAENLLIEVQRNDLSEMDGVAGPAVRKDMQAQTTKTLLRGKDGFFLHLQGLPFSVTREDVRVFFKGLLIDDILLMKNHRGQNNGVGMVRFGTIRDAYEGLKRDREYLGNRFIEINACSEEQWVEAGGSARPFTGDTAEFHRESPPSYVEKRFPRKRTRSISPARYRSRSSSPSDNEYCVLMENISYSVDKQEIKSFFHPVELKDDQILHLHNRSGIRTRAAFVLFRSLKDYCAGLARDKKEFAGREVSVSPISQEKMVAMLDAAEQKTERSREKPSTSLGRHQHSERSKYESERVCIYVRNLPFDIRTVEVMDFFHGLRVTEDMVHLLRDKKGAGLGEALVTFTSEQEAVRAEQMDGQRFLGSLVMLKRISRMQMQEFGVMEHQRKSAELPPRMRSPERYSTRRGEVSDIQLDEQYPDIGIPYDVRMPVRNSSVRSNGSSSRYDSRKEGRDTFVGRERGSAQRGLGNQFDGPACLKLTNLPLNISIDEIYDFCHGYRVIPGSVSLLYNKNGSPKGSATVVFDSRPEALTAIQELSGRPIGTQKIELLFL